MRAKCLALIIAGFVLSAVSSAQEYSIRANRGLNLRAAPSLNADIADTVRSGTILQVVGNFNRWLKIHRNGREVWLADWVDYSRIDSVAPPASPAPTGPIDNCCYVDRHCQSDLDWIGGWHAFQNGQCAAPAQPQPATPAQPAASAPANVDNCCFVNRHCQSELDWIGGWHAFQNGQCFAPAQSVSSTPTTGGNCCNLGWDCPTDVEREQGYWTYRINQCAGLPQYSAVTLTGPVPRIEGSGRFVQHVMATLKLMKSVAPAWYHYVVTGMDVIVEVPVHLPPGYYDGQSWTCTATARARERRVTLESCWIDMDSRITGVIEHDLDSTAAALGHEACHVHTHAEGKYFATQEDEEAECRKFGTGASVFLSSALATGLNPSHGFTYFPQKEALNLLRQYCSQGYRSDLFCPTLQRLESIWRNVPHAVFPPGAPQW